jgi:transcriptional regulator with XRE-family HTH domain
MVNAEVIIFTAIDLTKRLVALCKDRGLTQRVPADRVGIHVCNIRRHEAGTSAPTLAVLRSSALPIDISADSFIFDEGEAGPTDDLRLAFQAASGLVDDESKALVRALVEGVMLHHKARYWADAS